MEDESRWTPYQRRVRQHIAAALNAELPELTETDRRIAVQPFLAAEVIVAVQEATEASAGNLRKEPPDNVAMPISLPLDSPRVLGAFPIALSWEGRRRARSLHFSLDKATGRVRWRLDFGEPHPVAEDALDPLTHRRHDVDALVIRLIDGLPPAAEVAERRENNEAQ